MPNLLNHLLRNIRKKERPDEPIDSVAASMNDPQITGTYLRKLESGELQKPKKIEPFARAYSTGAVDWLPLLNLVDAYVREDKANDDPAWPHLKDAHKLLIGSPFSRCVYGTINDQLHIDHRGVNLMSTKCVYQTIDINSETGPCRYIKPSVAEELTFGTACAVSFHEVILIINPFHAPLLTASPEVLTKWHRTFNIALANPES